MDSDQDNNRKTDKPPADVEKTMKECFARARALGHNPEWTEDGGFVCREVVNKPWNN